MFDEWCDDDWPEAPDRAGGSSSLSRRAPIAGEAVLFGSASAGDRPKSVTQEWLSNLPYRDDDNDTCDDARCR